MKMQKMSLGTIILVLMLTSAAAMAGPFEAMHLCPGGKPPLMGPGGIATDKQFLYVLAGPKIMQFSLEDLRLLKTVDLPKPTPPKEKAAMPCPPPFPPKGVPQGLCAGDGSLYVLAGPVIYRFKTPDLTMESSAQLPKPEMPRPEPPAGN
jgi:hypothetical protein